MDTLSSSVTNSLSVIKPRVKVVGVGGAGGNLVEAMHTLYNEDIKGFYLDTDLQSIRQKTHAFDKILLGEHVTRGMSAGGDWMLGHKAIEASKETIAKVLADTDLVFLVGGLGGGTGGSGLMMVAELAIKESALVIAFVTMPFAIEGSKKWEQAEDSLRRLRSRADAVVVIPNDLLLQQVEDTAFVLEAFAVANDWVRRAVESVTTILFQPGFINLDFATLRQIFTQKGDKTLFALGYAEGENYVQKALDELLLCPLTHITEQMRGADNVLINLIGGQDLSLATINQVLSFVNAHFNNKNKTCLGAVIDPNRSHFLEICVMGTMETDTTVRGQGKIRTFIETNPQSKNANVKVNTVKAFKKLITGSENQEEFPFVSRGHMRGYFDQTDKNTFDGEDLDVPTYLRKGIKISI